MWIRWGKVAWGRVRSGMEGYGYGWVSCG
ncbi:hypothetical protein LCGC14_0644320, partial [marine sediment metagenome]